MRMRAVDLAVFADVLAGRAGALAARLERGRDLIRQAAIEREARRSLGAETVARLVELGVLPGRTCAGCTPRPAGWRPTSPPSRSSRRGSRRASSPSGSVNANPSPRGTPRERAYAGASATRRPPSSS